MLRYLTIHLYFQNNYIKLDDSTYVRSLIYIQSSPLPSIARIGSIAGSIIVNA